MCRGNRGCRYGEIEKDTSAITMTIKEAEYINRKIDSFEQYP
jgi:hypothetical protein